MNAEILRELQDRGKFFYERFPGAAAAEEWRHLDRLDKKKTDRSDSAGESAEKRTDPAPPPTG